MLIISAGLGPAASSSFGQDQGEYGQYSQQAPPPPSPYDQNQSQNPDYAQAQAQSPSQAQTQDAQADAASQPGVARASYVHGSVSTQRGDNGDLVPTTVNAPLEAGDRISTSGDARAEIELDSGDQIRLSGDATAKIASLNRQNIQVQVGQGLVTYALLPGSQAQVEVDTPNAALHPDTQGDYRILVNSDSETKIVVRSGSADISTPQGSTHVDAGQMITIAGTDNPQYRIDTAPGRDEWDTWNADRDQRVETAQSFHDTNSNYTGSEDLDTYGAWSEVPDYGNVWFPNDGSDWAPYRDGSWVYEPYYGWTWVSSEPWGWAPYHYGRWFVYGGRWGWWPGPVYAGYYPMWAPAYVSFFGWGGVGFGFGFGGWGTVGWLPIGPGDWFHPWYGRFGGRFSPVGFRNITGFHGGYGPLRGAGGYSNLHDALANGRLRSGISTMSGSEFGRGRVSGDQGHVTAENFRQSSMMTGRVPMTPSRASFSPTGRSADASAFRNMPSSSQRFFTANRGGTAGGNFAGRQSTTGAANRGGSQSVSQAGQAGRSTSNWRTFTPPTSANRSGEGAQGFSGNRGSVDSRGAVENRSANNGAANGWHTFTPPSRESQAQSNTNRGYQAPQASRGTSNSYSRPTLNMRQPVVTPRGNYGNSAPRGNYNYSAPRSYSGGSNYSAPRGGNYSAPRGGSGYSAPRGGGGGSTHGSGGGGGHRR